MENILFLTGLILIADSISRTTDNTTSNIMFANHGSIALTAFAFWRAPLKNIPVKKSIPPAEYPNCPASNELKPTKGFAYNMGKKFS
jgi:hypothetical protein